MLAKIVLNSGLCDLPASASQIPSLHQETHRSPVLKEENGIKAMTQTRVGWNLDVALAGQISPYRQQHPRREKSLK
ncbi:hypothetical protein AAY473_034335, partial [Plecturocebus cupreus]